MKRSANSLCVLSALAILLPAGTCRAAERGKTATIRLPPLAVVTEEDDSGRTWRQNGEIRASLEVARRDFEKCLVRQGWRLGKTIPLARGKNRSLLCMWNRKNSRLLVMLKQARPGKCLFSWGIR